MMTLSDAANWATLVSLPLMVITWLFTRERFAGFWKKRWKLLTMTLFVVTAIGTARMGWFSWLNCEIKWPLWKLVVLAGAGVAIPLLVFVAAKYLNQLCDQRSRFCRRRHGAE